MHSCILGDVKGALKLYQEAAYALESRGNKHTHVCFQVYTAIHTLSEELKRDKDALNALNTALEINEKLLDRWRDDAQNDGMCYTYVF
jgi:hypothetical protein